MKAGGFPHGVNNNFYKNKKYPNRGASVSPRHHLKAPSVRMPSHVLTVSCSCFFHNAFLCHRDPEGRGCRYAFFEMWSREHLLLLASSLLLPSSSSLCLTHSGVLYMEVRRPSRVMVLVNPQSGRGQALQLFTGHVQSMLTEAALPYTLIKTGL